jgi:hypothetical protein
VSFEKEIFRHHSLFDSIHPNLHSALWRTYQMSIKKSPQRQTTSTDFLAEQISRIQKCIWFRRCDSAIDIFQSWQRYTEVSYFFATLNMQEIPDEELQSLLFPERSEKAQNQG